MSFDKSKLFVRDFERYDESVLKISQSEVGDVGCVVWDAAIVLSSYLETEDFHGDDGKPSLRHKRVVELGAGTGLVGLQAAALGGSSIITDLPEFIPLIELNIERNQDVIRGGDARAASLTWGSHDQIIALLPHPDIILLADCVYYEESIEPLVQTIRDLSAPETIIYCCHEERTTGNKPKLQELFFKLVGEIFEVEKIPLARQHPVYHSEDIHIHKFRKKVNV